MQISSTLDTPVSHSIFPMSSPVDLRPYLEELERFADGQMTEAEQEDFEQRMEHDEALSSAYEAYERFTADLRWVAGHETLRHRLQALDQRLDERQDALVRMQQEQRRARTRWTVGVTGLLLLLGVGLWLLLRPRPDEAWARYYVPEPGLTEAAAQSTHNPVLIEAMRHYRDGQYRAASFALRRMPARVASTDTVLYFMGTALLRQNKSEAARSYLSRVSRQPGSALAAKASYHLAMAQLRTGQEAQAQAALQAISADPQNPYHHQAHQMLQANANAAE